MGKHMLLRRGYGWFVLRRPHRLSWFNDKYRREKERWLYSSGTPLQDSSYVHVFKAMNQRHCGQCCSSKTGLCRRSRSQCIVNKNHRSLRSYSEPPVRHSSLWTVYYPTKPLDPMQTWLTFCKGVLWLHDVILVNSIIVLLWVQADLWTDSLWFKKNKTKTPQQQMSKNSTSCLFIYPKINSMFYEIRS